MEEQQKNIDDLFRQSLSDYREAPPAAAWDRLAAQLDADGIEPKNRYFFSRWLWFSLVFILLVGGGWLGWCRPPGFRAARCGLPEYHQADPQLRPWGYAHRRHAERAAQFLRSTATGWLEHRHGFPGIPAADRLAAQLGRPVLQEWGRSRVQVHAGQQQVPA